MYKTSVFPYRLAAVVQVARSQLRRRLGASVVLAVVVALVAGLAIALLAGSRRSGSALDRAVARITPFALQVTTEMAPEDLAALPGVERAISNPYLAMRVVRPDGTFDSLINGTGFDWDVVGGVVRVVRGKLPDGSDPLRVIINEAAAQTFGVGPGDDLVVRTFGLDQGESLFAGNYAASGPTYTFHVGAVYRSLLDLSADEVTGPTQIGNHTQMIVPNTFYAEHGREFLTFTEDYQIRLDDHTRVDEFQSSFIARSKDLGLKPGPEDFSSPLLGANAEALRSPIGFETTLLLVLGLLTAGAGLVVVTLLLRADQRALEAEARALQALGLTGRQLAAVAAARVVPVAALGTLGAMVTAVTASTLFPVGLGRLVEPTPGVDVNLAALALGSVCTMLAVVAVAAAMGLTYSTRPRRTRSRPLRRALIAHPIFPAAATIGARLAFDRSAPRRSMPSRQAIVGGALSVALVVGVAGYAAGLSRLHGERAAHGFPWDAVVGNPNFAMDGARRDDLRGDTNIAASADAALIDLVILDGEALGPGWAQDTSVAAVAVTVLRGRAPRSGSEIALGERTLRTLGRDIGDTTQLAAGAGEPPVPMTIVGVVLLSFVESDIGSGALMTLDGLARIAPGFAPQFTLIRLRDDIDRAAAIDRLVAHHDNEVTLDVIPAQIANLWRVRWLPLLGAATVGLLGAVLVAYTLTAAGRARAREAGVLRALGMTSGAVYGVMAWQGALIAGGVLVLGVPIGLVGGAAAWRSIASHMAVDRHVVVSPWVSLLVPLIVMVAVLASCVPARRRHTTQLADALRVE